MQHRRLSVGDVECGLGIRKQPRSLGGSVLVATRHYRWSLVANRAKSVPRVAGTPQPPSPNHMTRGGTYRRF